jgi:putative ABC transport system ATP-binding protein
LNRTEDAIARCRGVDKIYPTTTGDIHALIDVDAEFLPGRVSAVVGPSGSGKSSLLRILAGLDRPTEGSVEVGDDWVSEMRSRARRRWRRRSVRYVFQRPTDNLISYLTVEDHMRLAAEITGEDDLDRIDEVLETIGIDHRRSNRPQELSGGEQQRLAFAQSVIGDPLMIVADEPTAELDAATTEATVELMASLTSSGTAVVVATHDPRVAEVAWNTIVLERGRRVS